MSSLQIVSLKRRTILTATRSVPMRKPQNKFLCATCNAIIPPSNTSCHVCDELFDREVAQANTNYFYSCSMEDQLRHFLEKRQLMQYVDVSKEKWRSLNAKSEICTGNEYRYNIGTVNFLQESNMNLTCTFNSDGIQPFNSARKSVWPLLCTINDLNTRYKSSFVFWPVFGLGKTSPTVIRILSHLSRKHSSCTRMVSFGKTVREMPRNQR